MMSCYLLQGETTPHVEVDEMGLPQGASRVNRVTA